MQMTPVGVTCVYTTIYIISRAMHVALTEVDALKQFFVVWSNNKNINNTNI